MNKAKLNRKKKNVNFDMLAIVGQRLAKAQSLIGKLRKRLVQKQQALQQVRDWAVALDGKSQKKIAKITKSWQTTAKKLTDNISSWENASAEQARSHHAKIRKLTQKLLEYRRVFDQQVAVAARAPAAVTSSGDTRIEYERLRGIARAQYTRIASDAEVIDRQLQEIRSLRQQALQERAALQHVVSGLTYVLVNCRGWQFLPADGKKYILSVIPDAQLRQQLCSQ